MPSSKKIFYVFLILLILFITAIVSAVNSSIVIDKIAKKFAPDYNISYEHISGNVFTGIRIDKLKYDNKTIANDIIYKWDPISLLQKKISINEIKIENADIDVIKALIASFDVDDSDDNSSNKSAASFTFDIGVDNVFISLKPFNEQGIAFHKTVLKAKDIIYFHHGALRVKDLFFDVDTNLTTLSFHGDMKDGKLNINALSVKSLDTKMLEGIIADLSHTGNTDNDLREDNANPKSVNPLIPETIVVKQFNSTIKPREYRSAKIDTLKIAMKDAHIDIHKILDLGKESFYISNIELFLDSNVTHMDFKASFLKENVIFDHLRLMNVDTKALQKFLASDTNKSETGKTTENNATTNKLIPKKIIIKDLQSTLLAAKYDPVEIKTVKLNGRDIVFDIKELLLEKAIVDINGTSNLTDLSYRGNVKDNHLMGKIHLTPNKPLFKLYKLPLRKEAFGTIVVDFNASKESIVATIKAKAKHILVQPKDINQTKRKPEAFNVDIDDLNSDVVYRMKNGSIKANTTLKVSTPYAKHIMITNQFLMDKNISYKGDISLKELIGMNAKLTKPLNHLHIRYEGDLKYINTKIDSDGLKGKFISSDFKKGLFHVETKKEMLLSNLLNVPDTLKDAKINAVIDMPIDFVTPVPLKGKASIFSNVVNLDADILYGKKIVLKAKADIPPDSLLKNIDKNIHWNAVSPLSLNAQAGDKSIHAILKSNKLNADMNIKPFAGTVDGKINFSGLSTTFTGNVKKDIVIKSKINSFNMLFKTINEFYTVKDLPKVDGKLDLLLRVNQKSEAFLNISSPNVIYHADRKTIHKLKDVNVVIRKKDSNIQLVSYHLNYNDMKVFATKPSTININENSIDITPLWLNDQLKFTGTYDIKNKKGTILANATDMKIEHKYADMDARVDLKALLDGNSTTIDGKVILLGGNIKYDLSQKSFASDSDIIIVQEMKKKKASPFMDNLSTNIQIETKKPLVYKQGPINIKAKAGLNINKAQHAPLLVLGSVELLKGGSYIFENKKFVLEKSFVYFTGDPNKPQLDIKVKYKSIRHLITIAISGTPETPNINFSSTPALTKEQILSVILFDSEEGGDTHSGDEMMKMMGGAMAKSALSDMGIKLDHLVFGEGGSVEVGKKLTNKMTIIYINGTIPEVKLIYQHGKHTESTIGASEKSQSYDIIYKNDF